MPKSRSGWLGVVVGVLLVSLPAMAHAQVISCPLTNATLSREHCSVVGVGQSTGVVRAKGSVDKATGVVSLHVEWETDDVRHGPCGLARADLYGDGTKPLASVSMDGAACIGGKGVGTYLRVPRDYTFSIAPALASQVKTITVTASKTGSHNGLFNISLKQLLDAIKVIGAVFAAA
ncbi:MAG: hypothetical protein JWL61_5423 [Gemmatimonadetes bacterium]|nr:hypothetical protein [Gemmatimonadota bacterium]